MSTLQARLQASLGPGYTVTRELPGAGMSHVFVAHDAALGRDVVIKVLSPERAAGLSSERFAREIRLAAALQEPHIVPVLSAGVTADGLPYYTMPFVAGDSLHARIEAGPVPLADSIGILRNVAQALVYAHQHGVIHRDIKPANVLLSSGTAVVTDFGIAKAMAAAHHGDEGGRETDEPATTLTEAGTSLGTPGYMAPEQAAGDEVDGRADLYAWGVIAYELLAGHHPFADKRTAQQMVMAHLAERPKPLVDRLPDAYRRDPVAREIAALAMRCLEKDPAARPASAVELLETLNAVSAPGRAGGRRAPIVIGAAALLVAAVSALGLWWSRDTARATALLPRIQSLASQGNYSAAFTLATEARRHLSGDSTFNALLSTITNEITIRSEPAGARVFIAMFGDSTVSDSSDGRLIGTTPVERYVVARGDYRVVIRAPGYIPVRRMMSRSLGPNEGISTTDRAMQLDVRLPRAGSVPDRMEPVPGGRYEIVGHDIGRARVAELNPFAIDRYEVSNNQFAEFVRAGGYRNAALWPPGDRATVDAHYVDQTGLPAPRDWVNGEPAAGRSRYPVVNVSWREASAYCAWRGNRLPTLFEWEKASRDGRTSRTGVLMPWGLYDQQSLRARRANFSGTDAAPVDAYPFASSPFGVYNMAGNVKEWLANRVGDGWGTTGGSWQDPMYLFSQVGSQSDGSPVTGFRCVRTLGPRKEPSGAEPLPVATAAPTYHPVGPSGYPALLEHYRYDRRPPNPRGRTVVETPDWVRERLWIDGPKGDSVLVYVFTPRSAEPPYETLVNIPSSAAFAQSSVPEIVAEVAGSLVKAGRAVVAPVLTGMLEHQGEWRGRAAPSSVEFRDRMVWNATEMRLAMDYASTRPDIDSSRFVYFSVSFGAGSRLPFAAVDPRFRAVVLLGAGIDERVQPTLPEAANFNFAPYIRAPKLVINGRQDEEHPWETRGKPLWDLLREPKELVLVDGAGHVVPPEVRTPRINAFLDRTLGPVVQKRR
jgi:hypothetical protein